MLAETHLVTVANAGTPVQLPGAASGYRPLAIYVQNRGANDGHIGTVGLNKTTLASYIKFLPSGTGDISIALIPGAGRPNPLDYWLDAEANGVAFAVTYWVS
jgi:hypothetical protein